MLDGIPVVERDAPATSTPQRPRVINSNVYTIDITKRFRDEASRLLPGSLVKDDQFTLFESVGALEIGDPKMDSGCVEDGKSFEDDFDVCTSLRPPDLIWLMDELLSREVAWHMGYPLSQTLFTSVYIEKLLWPDPVQLQDAQFTSKAIDRNCNPLLHKVFRSYCLGLIKSCDLVLSMVTSQHYYEEEDFATQLYNRELLHRFSVTDILAEMESGIADLDSIVLDNDVKDSLRARMSFRSCFLSMLSNHTTTSLSGASVARLDELSLQAIKDTQAFGTAVSHTFTLKIQQRLASTVPPRPMVTIDRNRTFDYLIRFVRDCGNAFSVLCASHNHDLLTAFSAFNSQQPQPSVYVRAMLQSWLTRDDLMGGVPNDIDFVINDLRSMTFAGSKTLHNSYFRSEIHSESQQVMQELLHKFIGKHGRSFMNIWRTACLNRCRVRRTLCHAALEWDQIQAEAEEVDDELQSLTLEQPVVYPIGGVPTFSYSLSSWVYHYKLIQLRAIVQLGFELDIYAPHELASMYWYLANLCDAHLAHLERISFFIAKRESCLPTPGQRSVQEESQADEIRTCLKNLYRQFSWLKATEATARALHGAYIVIQRFGLLQRTATAYASDGLRYELRMRPFLYLSIPEPLSFAQFNRLSRVEIRNNQEILEEAVTHISTAKKGWEEVLRAKWNAFPLNGDVDRKLVKVIEELWITDIRGAVKATISTSILINRLKQHLQNRAMNSNITAEVPKEGEKDYWHAWWLVPRITP